jgi:hypothetical protein
MRQLVRGVSLSLAVALIASMLGIVPLGRLAAAPAARPAHADIGEVEPNDSREAAQALGAIGRESPLVGQTGQPGDRDWFSFAVTVGRTYVVELFNVANTLGADGRACNSYTNTGMVLRIYNETGTKLAGDCEPAMRTGNVHAIAQFTASTSGNHTIEVFPNGTQVIGGYSLRVLPKYDEGGAWDGTFEPNNQPANAFQIAPGLGTPLTAAIEQRNPAFSTFAPDRDYYRIDAVAGRTYTVELFNVSNVLGASGRACDTYTHTGLGLFVYSPSLGNAIAGRCEADGVGAGNVHAGLEFTAGVNGPHYIMVVPNGPDVSGPYSLRVLPKFDEGGAAWDPATFEPNQRAANAYQVAVGRETGVRAAIEQREPAFSTFFDDVDWYRFTAEAGKTYVVELFDVANTLGGTGRGCDGYSKTGMALLIYSPTLGKAIAGDCNSTTHSAGNVHSIAEFTAGVSGNFFIQVLPNSANVSGPYSLRVLKRFDEGGSWDTAYEPNNAAATAYLLPERSPAVLDKAAIEARDPQLATNRSDVDWYAFKATAGRQYTVELLKVDGPLTARGNACNGYTSDGLGLLIYSPALGNAVAGQCDANGRPGTGIHTGFTFTAGATGIFYIQVLPNVATASGGYTLRACEGTCPPVMNQIYLPLQRKGR